MNFDNVKAMIFDFDGTLGDTMQIWAAFGIGLLKRDGIECPDTLIRDITPLGAKGTAEYFINLGLNMTIEEVIEGINANAVKEYAENVLLKPGAEKFIKMMKEKGMRLCILSASSETDISACLKRIGILEDFEFIMTCDKAKMLKNNPEIYKLTLDKLSLQPEEAIFFDDNCEALKTAKSIGLKTVGVYDETAAEYREEIMGITDGYIYSFYELTGLKASVLDSANLGDDIILEPVKQLCDTTVYKLTNESEVEEHLKNADVAVVNKIKMNENTLKNVKNLRLICVTATGYDNIDTEYCKKRGIALCNVKGYSTHSVAMCTISNVLALATSLFSYKKYVENGNYTKNGKANHTEPVFHEIKDKTWGILGYGNIGREVGKIAEALGCKVIYTKNTPDEKSVSYEELFRNSDIITIHSPLNDKTRGLVNEETIKIMKDGVILVNEARGAITDEKAVAEALKSGKIGAFGSDVYSVEPYGENHPFCEIASFDNVCLTPHCAWGAYEARQRCIEEISENIRCFIKNEKRNRIV